VPHFLSTSENRAANADFPGAFAAIRRNLWWRSGFGEVGRDRDGALSPASRLEFV
jgi:hypothetical protein